MTLAVQDTCDIFIRLSSALVYDDVNVLSGNLVLRAKAAVKCVNARTHWQMKSDARVHVHKRLARI